MPRSFEQVAIGKDVSGQSAWIYLDRAGLAQGGATGAISGTVLDPSGAVVASAEIRIVNQDTGTLTRTTATDANGSFTATLLPGWQLHGERGQPRFSGRQIHQCCGARD